MHALASLALLLSTSSVALAQGQVVDVNQTPTTYASNVRSGAGPGASAYATLAGQSTAPFTLLNVTQLLPGQAPEMLAVAGGHAFVARTPATGTELFFTDGTPAGTHVLADLVPGAGSSHPMALTAVSGGLVFLAKDPLDIAQGPELTTTDWQLYFTDGTAAGTGPLLTGAGAPDSYLVADDLTVLANGTLLAFGRTGTKANLFAIDPVARTSQALLTTGQAATSTYHEVQPIRLDESGTRAAFWRSRPVNPFSNVFDFMTTDGTVAGTTAGPTFNKWNPSSTTGLAYAHKSSRGIARFGGEWVFAHHTSGPDRVQLWSTDGTAAGSHALHDVPSGVPAPFFGADLRNGVEVGGRLYFHVNGAPSFAEAGGVPTEYVSLWSTDGTAAGMRPEISALHARQETSRPSSFGGALYYAYEPTPGSGSRELVRLDANGVQSVATLASGNWPANDYPQSLFVANGALYAFNVSKTVGLELLKVDAAGSVQSVWQDASLKRVPTAVDFVAEDDLRFWAHDDSLGSALFGRQPGQASATFVTSLPVGAATLSAEPFGVTAFGPDAVILAARVDASEIWQPVVCRTDGSCTVLAPGGGPLDVAIDGGKGFEVGKVGNELRAFFWVDGANGDEIWQTNGTSAGTGLLFSLGSGAEVVTVKDMGVIGGRLVYSFVVKQIGLGTVAQGVHAYDGEGAVELSPWGVDQLTEYRGKLYFSGSPAGSNDGPEPSFTNGTLEGTGVLKDVVPGIVTSSSNHYQVVGDYLVFRATSPDHGFEPWITDGTTAGTQLLFETLPGTAFTDYTLQGDGDQLLLMMSGFQHFWIDVQQGTANLVDSSVKLLGSPSVMHDGWFYSMFDDTSDNLPPTLWRTNGVVREVAPLDVPGLLDVIDFVEHGDQVFARAASLAGEELFRLGDTVTLLPEIGPGVQNEPVASPSAWTALGNFIALAQTDPVLGTELVLAPLPGALSYDLGGKAPFGGLMSADAPTLGQTMQLAVEGNPDLFVGLVVFSLPTSEPNGFGVKASGASWMDPASFQIFDVFTGPAYAAALPLPKLPALAGAELHVQAWHLPPDFSKSLTSNAVRLHFDF